MDDDIMLSIYVATYNHEKYIGMALDSILMQKTKYKFEVLVGEDCSTDNTRKVLQEYERKYPGYFTMLYREHNMHNGKLSNAGDLKRRCKGKYIIALEGDDYWIDENKIEEQVNFLESHPEYIAVAHNCMVVDENSRPKEERYQECTDEEYTIKHFVSEIMPGQLATVMYRNYMHYKMIDTSLFEKGLHPGDRLSYFALVSNGKVKCIQKIMSAYRHITKSGTSFSATYKYDFIHDEEWNRGLVDYARIIMNKEAIKYAELLYFRNLMNGMKLKQCSRKEVSEYCDKANIKKRIIVLYITYWIKHHIFHRKLWV